MYDVYRSALCPDPEPPTHLLYKSSDVAQYSVREFFAVLVFLLKLTWDPGWEDAGVLVVQESRVIITDSIETLPLNKTGRRIKNFFSC